MTTNALSFQLVATLENLTTQTQNALDKASLLDSADIEGTSDDPGPFEDVCEYFAGLISLTTSGSGLSAGTSMGTKGEQYAVYTSFEKFSKLQQELFLTLTRKAGDATVKVDGSRLVSNLKEYEGTFDILINQLAVQCPTVGVDITSEHKGLTEALRKAIKAWS